MSKEQTCEVIFDFLYETWNESGNVFVFIYYIKVFLFNFNSMHLTLLYWNAERNSFTFVVNYIKLKLKQLLDYLIQYVEYGIKASIFQEFQVV